MKIIDIKQYACMYRVPEELLPNTLISEIPLKRGKWLVNAFNRHNRAYLRTDDILEEMPCHRTDEMHEFSSAEEAFEAITRWHDNPQFIECPSKDTYNCKLCLKKPAEVLRHAADMAEAEINEACGTSCASCAKAGVSCVLQFLTGRK